MQHISPSLIKTSLPDRISYLFSFLDFTPEDGEAILALKPYIAPLVPTVLDAVYTKLLGYDITAQAFVPRNTDYEGDTAENVQKLTLDHPQIAFRKDFLKNYLVRLVTTSDLTPTSPFWVYLNNVGIMHTGKPGFKHRENRPDLKVDYIHIGALLGYVQDLVVGALMGIEGVDIVQKTTLLRAFNKLLWIQNDLFARHYIAGEEGQELEKGSTNGTNGTNGVDEEGKGGECPFKG